MIKDIFGVHRGQLYIAQQLNIPHPFHFSYRATGLIFFHQFISKIYIRRCIDNVHDDITVTSDMLKNAHSDAQNGCGHHIKETE